MNNYPENLSMEERLKQFEWYLVREGNKPSSIREALKLVARLRVEAPSFSLKELEAFVLRLKEEGKVNSTINHYIIYIRHWGKCFNIPELASMKRIKGNNSTFEKATMSDEEIEAFLTLPYIGAPGIWHGGKQFFKKRYKMWTIFFTILAYTGARPSEISHLMVDDVDFGQNVFLVDGKTGKRRIPISFAIKDSIQEYIRNLKGSQLFPCYRRDGFMDGQDWRYPFAERIKRLGIKRKNLTPYSLRHSFITRMVDENLSLFKIQKIVGHRQIETTSKYVHLSEKAMQETMSSDPLASSQKSALDHLRDVLGVLRELEGKYIKTLYTQIEMSEDGKTIVLKMKAR